jgi:hypothetical protein
MRPAPILGILFVSWACTQRPDPAQPCDPAASDAGRDLAADMAGPPPPPYPVDTYADNKTFDIRDTDYTIPEDAYFVSPRGDDANPGTESAPWQTVAHAVKNAPAGTTVVLRGGTYRESVTLERKLTLQAYPKEKAWMKGSKVITNWVADGGAWSSEWTDHYRCAVDDTYYKYSCEQWTCDEEEWGCPAVSWTAEGDTIPPEQCPDSPPRAAIDCRFPLAKWADMVFLDGIPLEQTASLPVAEGQFYVDTSMNQLYIGSDPRRGTVEAAALRRAIHVGSGAKGTVIRGLGFAHYADSYANYLGTDLPEPPSDATLGGPC